MQSRMGGIIQANIPDIETLFASYMPFVAGGGLFIPSNQTVKLGDEVFVLTTLPEQSQKIPLTGASAVTSTTPTLQLTRGAPSP